MTYLDMSGFVEPGGYMIICVCTVCACVCACVCRGLSRFVEVCRGLSGFVEPGGYMMPYIVLIIGGFYNLVMSHLKGGGLYSNSGQSDNKRS